MPPSAWKKLVHRVAHDEPPVAQGLSQVRPEVDVQVVTQRRTALEPDAQFAPYGAARAVRGHEEPGPYRLGVAAVAVPQYRGDAFGAVVGERHQLGAEPDHGTLFAGPGQQDRLVPLRGRHAPPARGDRVGGGEAVPERLAARRTRCPPRPGVP